MTVLEVINEHFFLCWLLAYLVIGQVVELIGYYLKRGTK